jgi:hypothetical protein
MTALVVSMIRLPLPWWSLPGGRNPSRHDRTPEYQTTPETLRFGGNRAPARSRARSGQARTARGTFSKPRLEKTKRFSNRVASRRRIGEIVVRGSQLPLSVYITFNCPASGSQADFNGEISKERRFQ